jgi:hypothetical protein
MNLQKVAKELEPLVKLFDFRRIKGQILVNIIEPLGITPIEIILNVYRYSMLSFNSDLNDTRGIPFNYYVYDESACGSKLTIEDNGKIVQAPNGCGHQNVRAKIVLENKSIFEWDVIIEKTCSGTWVGVCASENFNYETFAGYQLTGWVLGSNDCCYGSGRYVSNYCPLFGDGARITVHLDMNERTCTFTVNDIKYSKVPSWNNLSSKLIQ